MWKLSIIWSIGPVPKHLHIQFLHYRWDGFCTSWLWTRLWFKSSCSVAVMKSSSVLSCPCCLSGLPQDGDVEEMKRVWRNAKDHSPKPMTILAALFHSPQEVEKMDLRLKVSREEKTLALFLIKHRQELRKSRDESDSLKPFTDFVIDVSVLRQCCFN